MRTLIWVLGLLAIGMGTMLAVAPSPTGAVVGGNAGTTTLLSLVLVVGGVLGLALTGLEDRVERDAQVRAYHRHLRRDEPGVTYDEALRRFNAALIARHTPLRESGAPVEKIAPDQEPSVFISTKALQRATRDSYIRTRISKYQEEIQRILDVRDAVGSRPTERIGKFNVSPLGKSLNRGIRVAWHTETVETVDGKKKEIVCIDDLLYHVKEGTYVDNWNRDARHGKVTPESYRQRVPYEAPK